jgi:hypothetical protein
MNWPHGKAATLLFTAIALASCTSDVRDYTIPADALSAKDGPLKARLASGNLSESESKLLHGYLLRVALDRDPKFKASLASSNERGLLGAPTLPMTVGEAIERQRFFLSEQLRVRAAGRKKAAEARQKATRTAPSKPPVKPPAEAPDAGDDEPK